MSTDDILKNPELLLANATEFLIEGQEFHEAGILLLCSDIQVFTGDDNYGSTKVDIYLTCERAIYNIFQERTHRSTMTIRDAFNAILPLEYRVDRIFGRVKVKSSFGENWRTEMLEMIEGKRPLNQGTPIKDAPRFEWEHLYFRSPAEVKIAQALEEFKVLFLPNCMARLSLDTTRVNREADFLVCHAGKWGILEVNGDTYHTSAAKDHQRASIFRQYGIRVFLFYEASRCLREPRNVVIEFLKDLKQNG